MIHIDKRDFELKCKEVIQDVQEQQIRSITWAWITFGAFAGLVASCIKFRRPIGKPFMASYTRTKGKTNG